MRVSTVRAACHPGFSSAAARRLCLRGPPVTDLTRKWGEKVMSLKNFFFYIEVWMEEPGRLQSMGSLRVGHD